MLSYYHRKFHIIQQLSDKKSLKSTANLNVNLVIGDYCWLKRVKVRYTEHMEFIS